jgi:hypothetical protein
MRIEQTLTLLDLADCDLLIDNKKIIKHGNEVSIYRDAKSNIKTAENRTVLSLFMPSAISKSYSDNSLKKMISSENHDKIEIAAQKIILKLASEKKPVPDVPSIMRICQLIDKEPDVLNLRFAQWGGMGNMIGIQEGRGYSGGGYSSAIVGPEDNWQSRLIFDEALMGKRGDPAQWYSTTEAKLESVGFNNHQYADENARNYTMSWADRIKHKNLQRLKTLFRNNRLREEKEKERSPKNTRFEHELTLNPRHYDGIETFLSDKRDVQDDSYVMNRGRMNEDRPKWYEELTTLRKEGSTKKANALRGYESKPYDSINKVSPMRRQLDPVNDEIFKGPADAAGAQVTRDYTLDQLIGAPWPFNDDEWPERIEETDQSVTQFGTQRTRVFAPKDQKVTGTNFLKQIGLEGNLRNQRSDDGLENTIRPEDTDEYMAQWNQHPLNYPRWFTD